MLARIVALPLIVILAGGGAVAMLIPGLQALVVREWDVARAFIYPSVLFMLLILLIAIATSGRENQARARNYLLALFTTFAGLPVMLAVPVYETMPGAGFLNAYLEMVSSLTTTGASFLGDPALVPGPLHLWRALVGWLGGFLVWVTAVAILAPMNLGGFEVTGSDEVGRGAARPSRILRIADPSARLIRFTVRLMPIYGSLTLALWILLLFAGETPLVAVCHAMSTLATSGISPVGGVQGGQAGFAGEAAIFFFLFFALSRRTFSPDRPGETFSRLRFDPEFRSALLVVTVLPLLLFMRHFVSAYEAQELADGLSALEALWGGLFTVLSFLSTTGFESDAWSASRFWSGLETPGLILAGLALVGGGVATTAGGVKLLRVYALYMHGRRELERLVMPSSVGGSGLLARRIRRQGAYIAWIFFMLFAISIALIMLALSLTGLDFEASTVLAVATLSTTGPLATVVADGIPDYAQVPVAAKPVLAAAMVLGRLETLAIIALFNPGSWRN